MTFIILMIMVIPRVCVRVYMKVYGLMLPTVYHRGDAVIRN